VGVWVGGNKACTASNKTRCFMDHIPVVRAGFTDNDKVWINIRKRLIQIAFILL
jgi:hypothetical protein